MILDSSAEKYEPSMPDAFANIAPSYRGRTTYSPKFFELLTSELKLGSNARVLDICCGQGELAKGIGAHVGEVVAIDKSEAMLAAARENAPTSIIFHRAEIGEGKDGDFGCFNAILVGRGLRYLPREQTVKVFEHSILKGGAVIACTAAITFDTPWRKTYAEVRRKYAFRKGAAGFNESRYFLNSVFKYSKNVVVKEEVSFSLDPLVENALSFRSSYERIASDIPSFRKDLEAALGPFMNKDGSLTAIVGSAGQIFQKRDRQVETS